MSEKQSIRTAVLVTGGAGYIGSVTCKALARAGYLPVVFDNFCRGHRSAVKWGPFERGDVGDRAALTAAMKKHGVIAVLHFAAFAYVGESMHAPEMYFENNVVNSLNLLEAMRECGLKNIVYSPSCATYGIPTKIPIDEDHPLCPINPYGETKRMVESALRWYDVAHGFRYIALRYFNAAGADPEGEVGECHDPETHLIPLAIAAALGRRSHVDIYGTDYPTPDGTAVRDYLHVADLAQAHVLALGALLAGHDSDVFNLGTGQGNSVREVMAAVERCTGVKGFSRIGPRREGDPPMLVADARKANARLNWQPTLSDIDTVVRTALDWHRR